MAVSLAAPNLSFANTCERLWRGFEAWFCDDSFEDRHILVHPFMNLFVDTILAPHLDTQKVKLGLPQSQCSVWKIDCWSFHKSAEFMGWMKKNYPNVIILFVPGGCTGIWQPLDVGIQRVLKQSIKRSSHQDIVDEATAQLANGTAPTELKLDTRLGVLRDRSVGWIVNAVHDINNKDLILKMHGCVVSFTSLACTTSRLSRCVGLMISIVLKQALLCLLHSLPPSYPSNRQPRPLC